MLSYHAARMATQIVGAWVGEYARPNAMKIWLGVPKVARVSLVPPKGLTVTLIFLLPPDVVGDLEEEFPRFVKRFGRRTAVLWYASQLLRSVPRFVWAALVKWVLGCHD